MENTENSLETWGGILENLLRTPYRDTAAIMKTEAQIYAALQRRQDDVEGLITLMFEQIMLGNRTKAKALAYKIWEIGGELNPVFEEIFTENLLNLGMLDMAAILLKSRFDNLSLNIAGFYPVLAKFALMSGDLSQLLRLQPYTEAGDDAVLYDLAEVYKQAGNSEQFKNISRLVLEQISEYLCSYEYDLYDDRGFPEIEIILYINFEEAFCRRLEDGINTKIGAYWQSSGYPALDNFSVRVENIKNHEAWDETENSGFTTETSASDWGF